MLSRRFFIRASAVAMAGVGLAPSWLVRAAAQHGNKRKILVAMAEMVDVLTGAGFALLGFVLALVLIRRKDSRAHVDAAAAEAAQAPA